MLIRLANRNDYPQLVDLLLQLNASDPPAMEATLTAFNTILDSSQLALLVADDNGILVASCYLNIIPNMTRGGGPYAVIENVVTRKEYRQRGIGKELMNAAVERAEKAGCYKVMLMTGRKDPAVHAFYKACGFSGDEKQAYIRRLSP